MNEKQSVRLSKFLSLVLRHQPSAIGITLDSQGWVEVDQLLKQLAAHGRKASRNELDHIVATNNKRRFLFSDDGRRIRANQGHSVPIDLGLAPTAPPEMLLHGTATRFLGSILTSGLVPGSRQHVHLSENHETAMQVGGRHGKPIVLTVKPGEMYRANHEFFLSDNGVWLTSSVPPEFILFPD